MVNVLQRRPTFGEQFGAAIGGGLGGGFAKGMEKEADIASQLRMEKAKQEQRLQNIKEVRSGGRQPLVSPEKMQQNFLEKLGPLYQEKQAKGEELTQDDIFKVAQDVQQEFQQQQPEEKTHSQKAEEYALLNEHELARYETELAKQEVKETSRKREKEEAKVEEVEKRVRSSRENLIQRRADYNIAESQIRQSPGDIGSLKNFISDAFHMPGLKTAPAAAFSAAIKDAYLESLKNIPGSRPNQWIEQQIQTAMARVGQSDEANLNMLEIGKFKLDLEERFNDIFDAIKDQYESKGLTVPASIEKEAYKQLKSYADERQKELAYSLRENFEKAAGLEKLDVLKTVPQGTPLTLEMKDILLAKAGGAGHEKEALTMAKNLGYEIPSIDFLRKKGWLE